MKLTRNMECESFRTVIHLVSEVECRTKAGVRQIQVLRSAFPAGTVSGAPKISAIEIVSSLERKTELYAGAIGYLKRTAIWTSALCSAAPQAGQAWTLQAGAASCTLPTLEREWEETNEARRNEARSGRKEMKWIAAPLRARNDKDFNTRNKIMIVIIDNYDSLHTTSTSPSAGSPRNL